MNIDPTNVLALLSEQVGRIAALEAEVQRLTPFEAEVERLRESATSDA